MRARLHTHTQHTHTYTRTQTHSTHLTTKPHACTTAARIIVAIENPLDVIAISARPYGQRAVLKFAQHVGAVAIAGRFTPGTFTNQVSQAGCLGYPTTVGSLLELLGW